MGEKEEEKKKKKKKKKRKREKEEEEEEKKMKKKKKKKNKSKHCSFIKCRAADLYLHIVNNAKQCLLRSGSAHRIIIIKIITLKTIFRKRLLAMRDTIIQQNVCASERKTTYFI